jgi:hypothetical protein
MANRERVQALSELIEETTLGMHFTRIVPMGNGHLLGIVNGDEEDHQLYLMAFDETDAFSTHVLVARPLTVYDSGDWARAAKELSKTEAEMEAAGWLEVARG